MGGGDQKNLLIATFLSIAVILVWQFVFFDPAEHARKQAEQAKVEAAQQQEAANAPAAPAGSTPALGATPAQSREAALAGAARVRVDSPGLEGSITLKGGRIDDIRLKGFRETLDPNSPNVTLLNPTGADGAYYAVYGWIATGGVAAPGPNTEWSVESGDVLTPNTPVTLVWDNGAGLIFRRVISVDDQFMFTVKQSVENQSGAEASLAPYGIVARHGEPPTTRLITIHEGGVAVFDGVLHDDFSYKDLRGLDVSAAEGGPAATFQVNENGWLGFTDKYWMAAMAPLPGQGFTGVFKMVETANGEIFQADMRLPTMTVAAGQTAAIDTYLFAGAKRWEAIRDYEANLKIDGFTEAMNWGTFFFLSKPMFKVLHFFYLNIGNMGWAILSLTLIVKTCLFPLAYKSFVSMSRMKKLQPEMEKLKERVGDDKQKLQQEMMALYKKERVNPASGCVPILLQIPIFFSLYKVISISLELRHAPFILWIKDLSAPDPTSVLNLFGLLPFAPPEHGSMLAIVSLGAFPILLGITMWLQQKLNPAPSDPMQQKIFAWMPWIFMFMLGSFASGLVIYWCFNNTLTFIQQFIIMRSQGVEVDFFGNVKKSFGRKKATGDGPAVQRAGAAKPANDNPGKGKPRRERKKAKGPVTEISNPGGEGGSSAPAKKRGPVSDGNTSDGASPDDGGSGGSGGASPDGGGAGGSEN